MSILYCGYKFMISNCRTDKLLLSFFRFERRANLLYSTVYVHMHLHATASINPIYCLFRHTSVPFSDLWVAHKVSKKRRPSGSKYGSKRQELLIGSWQTPRSSLKIRLRDVSDGTCKQTAMIGITSAPTHNSRFIMVRLGILSEGH